MGKRSLLFPEGELSPEQKALIQQAGEEHGIPVILDEGGLTITGLSATEQARIAFAVGEQWGIPLNTVRVEEVD